MSRHDAGLRRRIYAAPTPPADLAGWGQPIGELRRQPKQTVTLSMPPGERYRSYLIWITKLPPPGQVRLNEVRLRLGVTPAAARATVPCRRTCRRLPFPLPFPCRARSPPLPSGGAVAT